MNLVWFRNDLRLADHPALTAALAADKNTMGVYFHCPKQHQIHGESPQKTEFIKAHVKDLRKRLLSLGVELLVVETPLFADVNEGFMTLLETYPIEAVYYHHNYWINEKIRDQSVFNLLKLKGITSHGFHANYLLPPGAVTKSDGGMYHVFTPYKNKYIEHIKKTYQLPLSVPTPKQPPKNGNHAPLPASFKDDHFTERLKKIWPTGEQAAHSRLKSFVAKQDYQRLRDYPAIDGTSSLSPYLTIGVVSAKQCLAHMLKQQGEEAFYSTWVSELIWRDFYNDLMSTYPYLAKHKVFKHDAVDEWIQNDQLFQQWQTGQTGFPIVDAGMRQLLAEGWMHNRVRMIVASFLTKLCLIDWRLGEAHFMQHLLDGDLASNNGGWQWSSATGCDAAPYFRIFNPTSQSKKFDAEGEYIRRYVKELAGVPNNQIHEPNQETRTACDYPQPVIDYKQARTRALEWFKTRKA